MGLELYLYLEASMHGLFIVTSTRISNTTMPFLLLHMNLYHPIFYHDRINFLFNHQLQMKLVSLYFSFDLDLRIVIHNFIIPLLLSQYLKVFLVPLFCHFHNHELYLLILILVQFLRKLSLVHLK